MIHFNNEIRKGKENKHKSFVAKPGNNFYVRLSSGSMRCTNNDYKLKINVQWPTRQTSGKMEKQKMLENQPTRCTFRWIPFCQTKLDKVEFDVNSINSLFMRWLISLSGFFGIEIIRVFKMKINLSLSNEVTVHICR